MGATVSWGGNQVLGKLSGLAKMVGAVGEIQFTAGRAASGSWERKSVSTIKADIAIFNGCFFFPYNLGGFNYEN